MKDLIKELVECYGPTGHEEQVRKLIRKHIKNLVDDIQVDTMGNLIARKGSMKPGGKKVMVAAHMDEIGMIATFIEDNGFIRFDIVGGVSVNSYIGSRVIFKNGTRGMAYMELPEDRTKVQPTNKMYIDVGATSREDCPVSVGDIAIFDYPFTDLGKKVMAKALDDRIGVAILIEALRTLPESPHELYFAFTVQEEVGLRGAETATFSIDPDIGIAVDVCTSGDQIHGRKVATALGKGPTIKIYDPYLVSHAGLVQAMTSIAEKHKVPYQPEVVTGGGTDAAAMQLKREGVAAGAISIVTRYIHSPSEIVEMDDVENAVKLLNAILSSKIDIE